MDEDVTSIWTIKADASQAIRETEKLHGAQHKLSKSVQEGTGGFQKFLDSAAGGLAKFNFAMEGVSKGMAMLKTGMDWAKEINLMDTLERALPTDSIKAMERASQGMIDRMSLLRVTTKGMTGDFAINEAQMGKLLQTAVALSQKGYGPAAEVANKLVEALGEKSVAKLDDFGIALTATADKAADNALAFKAFDNILSSTDPLDERTRKMAELERTIENVSLAIKRMVAAAVNAIATVVDNWNEYSGDFFYWLLRGTHKRTRSSGSAQVDSSRQARADSEASRAAWNAVRNKEGYEVAIGGLFSGIVGGASGVVGLIGGAFDGAPTAPAPAPARRPGRAARIEYVDRSRDILNYGLSGRGVEGSLGSGYDPLSSGGLDAESLGIGGYQWLQQDNARARRIGGIMGAQSAARPGPDVFGDMVRQSGAVEGFAGATQAAMGAAVAAAMSGSDAIGKAAARASAAVLKSLAIEALGRAAFEAALGVASLALGPIGGISAAGHFKASAAFLGAAAAMGVAGQGLGALAGGGGAGGALGAGGGGGFSPPVGGQQGGSAGPTIVINFGDGFVGDAGKVSDFVVEAVKDGLRRGNKSLNSPITSSG